MDDIARAIAQAVPVTPAASWLPVDLGPVLESDAGDEEAGILFRADGVGLLYPGRTHTLHGETESLKSWLVQEAIRQAAMRGETVLLADYEDSAYGAVRRLRHLGLDDQQINAALIYLAPAERIGDVGFAHLERTIEKRSPVLCVVDATTEAMTVEGLDLDRNQQVAEFYERLPRRLARLGPAVWLLDHVTKARESRGRFAIGAQAKLAGIDGAGFAIETVMPFGREKTGKARLFVAKDRHGAVSEHAVGAKRLVAEIHATSMAGAVEIDIREPETSDTFRPTFLMSKLSAAIEATPGLSWYALRAAVSGGTDNKRLALETLIAEGYVRVEAGARGATLHYPVNRFEP